MLEAQLLHLVSRNLAPATPPRQPAPAAPGNPASRAQFEAELQKGTQHFGGPSVVISSWRLKLAVSSSSPAEQNDTNDFTLRWACAAPRAVGCRRSRPAPGHSTPTDPRWSRHVTSTPAVHRPPLPLV
eukprot:scaffold105954_cov75-Phaeocystis_antarctica.AAC.2